MIFTRLQNLTLLLLMLLLATIDLMAQPGNGPGGPNRDGRINGRPVNINPRPLLDSMTCKTDASLNFRTIDGTCNNIRNARTMEYGATDILFERALTPVYGSEDRFNALGGEGRRSPREISNIVVEQPRVIFSEFNLSAVVYNWGQFIDHDFALTPENEEEPANIELPADESIFTEEIHFARSEYINEPMDGEPREQFNNITAWIDGSMVYGAEASQAAWLRTFTDGKLKSSEGNLLPFNTIDGEYDSEIDTLAPSTAGADDNGKMWIAGDFRVGEQTGLTSLHTLFMREHNRICDELIANGMTDDEMIYQNARKEVVGLIQKITFDDFLPALGVSIPEYENYQENINPSVTNIFTTAAWRIGHTMVVDSVRMFDNNCNPAGDTVVSLRTAFFNPEIIREHDIDFFLKGLSIEVQYEVDPYIVPELKDFLFTPASSPVSVGLDLAAANIQRGRDHGLPDYNTIRANYIGTAATDFSEISSDPTISANLQTAFNNDINEIDAWIGLISEDRVSGTSFGPTMHAILVESFGNLRDGDRFWYERYLDEEMVTEINSTTLADVIIRNTGLTNLPENVFFADESCTFSTSTIEPSNVALKVFPNPSTGIINVSFDESKIEIENFKITSTSGVTVYESKNFTPQIDISFLSNGIYHLHLDSDSGLLVERLVIIK